MASSNKYPVSSYHFKVLIGSVEFSFKEISGIKANVDFRQEERQGGDVSSQHKVFDKFSFSNIKLSKGLVKDGALAIKVIKDLFKIEFDQHPSSVSIEYLPVIITLIDEGGNDSMVIALEGAYPMSWEISTFDAMSKELAIESIELNYQKLRIS